MMKLKISNRFKRDSSRIIKKNPELREKLADTLLLLKADIFNPVLKTHKLKGELKGLYSSSWGYDLRVIFELSGEDDNKVIEMITAGTHDEVY
ncbi:MAG TPA: type II toxin-antitoxin system mRNA interferase toxin, RelE/StbE family [Ignavibacteria bacterium]|nr:type II toxin-antitoxin system mRNA interferase toxin, RelE/StbE family [Ignavibacteria bacterium]HMR00513.1 type II toxin-antitoxin system mRNA interferase toxin, RelE/StbE family [Ignavibacteria bacterium]